MSVFFPDNCPLDAMRTSAHLEAEEALLEEGARIEAAVEEPPPEDAAEQRRP